MYPVRELGCRASRRYSVVGKAAAAVFFLALSLASPARGEGFLDWLTGPRRIVIVPGVSIAGISLGMSREKVLEKLGQPKSQVTPETRGVTYAIRDGKRVVTPRPANVAALEYDTPSLAVVLENSRVVSIQAGCDPDVDLVVKGYEALKWKYISLRDLASLGKPKTTSRDRAAEPLFSRGGQRQVEYYVYQYEPAAGGVLVLGLIFYRDRERKGKAKYIVPNYISVMQ